MVAKKFIIEKILVGPMLTNCYLFGSSSKEAAIIDPGAEAGLIKKRINGLRLKPKCIIITHAHIDHIGAIGEFDLPVYAGEADSQYFSDPLRSLSSLFGGGKTFKEPARLLKEGDKIDIGECSLGVIEVPGHTPGSICLLGEGVLFSGDTLFAGGIGRTDFAGGSHRLLVRMIKEKLFSLDETIEVYPGHGETTTIAIEKRSNTFLG